ncbi:MAG: nucleotidyltransferase domain-containing protein [archaeon]|nr:nucleotidyltransferase domain-containing protein [archaeon]
MADSKKQEKKIKAKDIPTLQLNAERDIAADFANKVYQRFDKMIKSVILFGSTAKQVRTSGSDIDIIVLIDDASVKFDSELIGWYRAELGKIIQLNPYKKELHINTVKLTTWWHDLMKGDPVILNIIRYGEDLIDFGGFFRPIKILLQEGKISSTPEAIYTSLQRAPYHLAASKRAELGAIEGIYWAMVDSAHALLMSAKIQPSSPEHIAEILKREFANKKIIDSKYANWYQEVFSLYKSIMHNQVTDIKGANIDLLQSRADEFIRIMAQAIRNYV